MTNAEKYKTYRARKSAFLKICTTCENCKHKKIRWDKKFGGTWQCAFKWLDKEAEEDGDGK